MSATSYFELHVTLLQGDFKREIIASQVEKFKWRHSVIDGDPNLGPGTKHYATRQFPIKLGQPQALRELFMMAEYLRGYGFEVVREKVEHVLYDSRSSKVRAACDGACPECHTSEPKTLKEWREQLGVTQKAMAIGIGVPLRTYEDLEATRSPTKEIHLKAARWFVLQELKK